MGLSKSGLVDRVAETSDLSKNEASKAVDGVISAIREELSRGGDVSVTGFGKFSVAQRSARTGVNPRTGEKMQIAAAKVPRFSPGSQLKEAVNGKR